MIFRQLFDSVSGTYSYLIASRPGAEALIIDPVLDKVDRYVKLMQELDLRLVKAVDTHLHADHVTGLGALRDRTRCITVMGAQSKADVVSMRLSDGDRLEIEGIGLLEIAQQPDIVAMSEGERMIGQFELSPRAVHGRADGLNGVLNTHTVVITIAENEMRVRGKKLHRVPILDIAAVQDVFDPALRHNRQRAFYGSISAMGVADDGNAHGLTPNS